METEDLLAKIKQFPIAFACLVVALGSAVYLYFGMDRKTDLQKAIYDEALKTGAKVERDNMAANRRESLRLDAHLTRLKEIVAELRPEGGGVDVGRLMDSSRLSTNILYFLRHGEDAGVTVTTPVQNEVNPKRDGMPNLTKFTALQYNFKVTGGWKGALDFLNRVETGKYFARIDALGLTPGRLDATRVEMNVTLETLAKK